jgi:hypothetical protein
VTLAQQHDEHAAAGVMSSSGGSEAPASEGLADAQHASDDAAERDVLRDVKFEGAEVLRVRQGVLLQPEEADFKAAGEMAPLAAGGEGHGEGEGERGWSRICISTCSQWRMLHGGMLADASSVRCIFNICLGETMLWCSVVSDLRVMQNS